MKVALAVCLLLLGHSCVWAQTNATAGGTATPYWENKTGAPIPGYPATKEKLIVCTSPWTPAVYCENGTDPLEWTGFEIETFRLVATRMGLRDSQIDLRCYTGDTGWDDMFADTYDTKCDITVAGLAPKEERIAKGMRFSVPSIRSGFGIMVSKVTEPPGMWYFLSGMTWEVWVLMIVTGVIVGVIVWLFEIGMRALNADTKALSNVMWDTLGRPVQMRDYRLSSVPANLTAVMWSFLVFILMVIYSANLTANLTVDQIKNDIKGLADLPGKAVGSWDGYADDLKKYNVAITPYEWTGPEDEVAMINTLKAGFVRALAFDNNLLEIYDATDCSTMLVGDEFHLLDQTVAYAPGTWQNHPGFVDAYDIAMSYVVQGTGGVDELTKRFIKVSPAACKSSTVSEGYSSVTLTEVSGLWVILASSVAAGILIVACYRLWEDKGKPWAKKKGWLKHHDKLSQSYATLKTMGYKKGDDDEWKSRYDGASGGYIDGSSDPMEQLPQGYGPRAARYNDGAQARTFNRSDTANRGVEAAADPRFTPELVAIRDELAALRAAMSAQGGTAAPVAPAPPPPSPSPAARAASAMERSITAHAIRHEDVADEV